MFYPEIKVVDCTIRDGGLTNDSFFEPEVVRAVYAAACGAGIDYVELGYRNNREMLAPEQFGPYRYCEESVLRQAIEGVENPKGTKLAIMMDSHKSLADDLVPKAESVVDMVRVATYVKDVDKAIVLANRAHELGYETAVNIMAISAEGSPFLDEALQQIEEETKALAVYIVDSYGSLYSEEVHFLVEKFQMYIKTKEIGVHMHNNQQLAFANTIEGIIKGAKFLDGTLYGLGRGAGNCPTELLIGFLKNPKYDMLPLLDAVSRHILPLKQSIEWGYRVPYMLTGVRNLHPAESIRWMDSAEKNDLVKFYKHLEVELE